MHRCPAGFIHVGEVVIRGDHVMDGYYREPEATAAVMSERWFHTGDMGVWDNENYIHIVDRKKDIIISGGENISSIEVEKAIAAHPSVSEAAVVAAPDQVGRNSSRLCRHEARRRTHRIRTGRLAHRPSRKIQNSAPLHHPVRPASQRWYRQNPEEGSTRALLAGAPEARAGIKAGG